MQLIDNFLNRITMYRLVLYYLLLLIGASAVLALFNLLPYSFVAIIFSAAILTVACWIFAQLCGRFLNAAPAVESAYISAFILALITSPVSPSDPSGILFLVLLGLLAIGSKYLFAIANKHIFNPAAFAVVVGGVVLGHYPSWWVGGNLPLLPFVLIGGLLVVRKLQRFDLFWSFSLVAVGTIITTSLPQNPLTSIEQALLHSPLIFLATIMLTEPQTMPPTRMMRVLYGALVGFLFAPAVNILGFYFTPEFALVVGNIFSYIVSPKGRLTLTLVRKEKLGEDMHDFAFTPNRKFQFKPGQYMEWTLPREKMDLRGNRRYFTVASSPTEPELHLGIKFYNPSSTFKQSLASLEPGGTILAGGLAGDFTLPKDPKQKLLFIAGGIGITPFRAMMQYLLDKNERRDAVLLYSNRNQNEIAYKSLFDHAQRELGIKTVYAGIITREQIEHEVPDWRERHFYISGPRAMVVAFERTLREMGVHRSRIKVDFFPGFV